MPLTEQEFLDRLAARRGRPVLSSPPPRRAHLRAQTVLPANRAEQEAFTDRFIRELTAVGGSGQVAEGLEAAGRAAADHIARVCSPGDVLFWDDPIALSARSALELAGFSPRIWPEDRLRCASAAAGVTSALFAIAETGSIALPASERRGRIVSLLPPLHVAIVPAARLLSTVGAAFRVVADQEAMPAALNLVTGPSRTADIEMELSIGVHGPANLHVVLYFD